MRDVVYILKNGVEPDELRYSLRSVAENFPCRDVWFVGGVPDGFQNIKTIAHEQSGGTKWQRARSSLLQACQCEDITEEFFLFNDDFFILANPEGEFLNMTNGTIDHRIFEITKNNGGRGSAYTDSLRDLSRRLKARGLDTISFAVHMPMLINKTNMLSLLKSRNDHQSFRSNYGNTYAVPFIFHRDVKIYDLKSEPASGWDYLSTTEQSFAFGRVGEWIRNRFPTPCRYEIRNYNRELYTEEGDDVY